MALRWPKCRRQAAAPLKKIPTPRRAATANALRTRLARIFVRSRLVGAAARRRATIFEILFFPRKFHFSTSFTYEYNNYVLSI